MTTYCGSRRTVGHGEADICGQMGYGDVVHQCDACKLKDLRDNNGWINQKTTPAQPGYIVKRWKNGALWAGVYTGGVKDSSFDFYINLPEWSQE